MIQAIIFLILLAIPASANVISQGPFSAKIPPATFWNDTFTGGAGVLTGHTSDSGHSWTVDTGSSGDMALNGSGKVKDNAGNSPLVYISAVSSTAEYSTKATWTSVTDGGGPACRVVVGTNSGYITEYISGAGEYRLVQRVAGIDTSLGTFTAAHPSNTVMNIQCYDAAKKLFLDGTERISSSDNTLPLAGRGGLLGSGLTNDTGDDASGTNK